jgi:VIT1/CCC1 family predicted Fe2+/Mn2+ transporter
MRSRDLREARSAFKAADGEASKRAHQKHGPEQHRQKQGKYIKSVVYGGLDGIITTFAVVAGVAGASLASGVVLILGFANLIADGLSMAMGDFLSTKAENEYNKAERDRETWEVENYPDGEKMELVEVYKEKGLSEEDARTVVEIISKNKRVWVDVMMTEELGIIESNESPLKNALATLLSFGLFGFIPLVAYVLSRFTAGMQTHTFATACVLTGLTLFALGAIKVRVTGRNWMMSGLETLVIGGATAVAAYGVGYALQGLA